MKTKDTDSLYDRYQEIMENECEHGPCPGIMEVMTHIILVIPTDFIQKHYNLYTEPKPNLKTVVEYFRDKENRQDVQFVNRSEPEHPGFVIRLNQRQV